MSFPHAKSLFVALGLALCCNASPIFAQHGGQHNAPQNEAHGNPATAATKATPPANPLTLTDMAGRKVVIPDITDRPYRVFGSAPPLNVLLHVINPENMIGL
ncbi:MAG: hypothetical protein LBQ81_09275, partial [Zoogloeaceae bacterium]|nr:hypothetical protein [Zoogloeaceae bacterium]